MKDPAVLLFAWIFVGMLFVAGMFGGAWYFIHG